jgi:hypothetical protein
VLLCSRWTIPLPPFQRSQPSARVS